MAYACVTGEVVATYKEYLHTYHWKEKREAVLADRNFQCQLCKGELHSMNYHVHHKTYENIGHERMSDLMLLCADCHKKLHESIPLSPEYFTNEMLNQERLDYYRETESFCKYVVHADSMFMRPFTFQTDSLEIVYTIVEEYWEHGYDFKMRVIPLKFKNEKENSYV